MAALRTQRAAHGASARPVVRAVGWGDVYRWQRPGQYVEFKGNGDGLYVVRSAADIKNRVLETDETDNAAYAYIQVTGESVRIIGR